MRNSFVIILLFLSLFASGATYYVDPSGSDSNSGSASSPWKTLAYACSKVKTAGDIIHLNSGTFIETKQSLLAVGVSIEGEGISSVIESRVGSTSFTILLSSSAEATNGNQHISDLKMDGNDLAAYGAIRVAYRKNVDIYNCTIIDFNYYGVSFINGEPPTTYATGNKFHDNIVTNCAGYYNGARGNLEIQGQDGMLIYNNNMTVNRGTNDGDVIYGVEGFLKNIKIYNNTLTKIYTPGVTSWDFAIEFWNCLGGIEIYNNTITGSIDLTRVNPKGNYDYSVWIHDNIIGQPTLKSAQSVRGILLEYWASDVIIERNLFQNIAQGVFFQQADAVHTVENITIRSNIFKNIGANVNNTGWGIYFSVEDYNDIVKNLNIWNNVFTAQTGSYSTMYGIGLPDIGTATNVSVRNNIIQGFDHCPIYANGTGSTTIRTLSVENNIFYGNGNSNAVRYVNGMVPTTNTTQNNIIANPLFVSSSDFHLQSGSPAVGKGISIPAVTTDYDGNSFYDPPSIGAFEYGSSAPLPDVPVYQSSVIENATPSLLDITYSTSLVGIFPPVSAFTVMVNSKARTINKITVSGTKVQLTLASPVSSGDVVTVSYTKPSSNQLQNASGGQASNLSSQSVTNKVSSVNPVYVSSAIANATPSMLEMTFDMTLANIVPAFSAFSVLVNSRAKTINKVTISGAKVQLTLSSPAVYGDVVTVSYTKPSSNPLQTPAGGQAATLSAKTVTNNISSTLPVYVSSAVENATPALLEMTYSLTLANIVPAASSFIVRVNSTARTVNKVAIYATKVQLTLASPIVFGDVVTVAYTKPSTKPLQTATGAQAATITAQTVTNKVVSAIPVYVSSVIQNATPSLLEMTYSLSLANKVPAATAFTVLVNSKSRPISKVTVTGTKVQLTLASPVVYGEIVTVAYKKPATNQLQTSTGSQAATITAQNVTNNVNSVIPAIVSSVIQNATPSLLEMTYSLTLANIVPSSSSFTVQVNSAAISVTKVVVSGTSVDLTLGSPVVYGDIVTVSYVKPSVNPLQTTSGGAAGNIVNMPVNNNLLNISPEIVITSPLNNASFAAQSTVTITADASDSDGSVSMVEFYNGDTKLGSTSGAPYSFEWNSVEAGIYSLIAIATDNYNAKTTSSAVSISVTGEPVIANLPPVVTISNPSKGVHYEDSASIDIGVVATDPDGIISKVELYNGSTKLAELTSAPYLYTLKDMKSGNYSIKAVAYDNFNATATSSLIDFKVGGGPIYDVDSEIINLYPNPNNGNFSIEILKPFEDEKCKVIISDLGGKQISNVPILEVGTFMHFDLSYIKSGIYIMMVIGKGILVTKKFIKY